MNQVKYISLMQSYKSPITIKNSEKDKWRVETC